VALDTSPESPAPLGKVSAGIASWVARLGVVWVEAQVTQLNRRQGSGQAYLEVRDVNGKQSMTMVTDPALLRTPGASIAEGDRIVFRAKPEFWSTRGQLVLRSDDVRAVGLGDLLARIERLKQELAKEGLFGPERKKPLPFLPTRVGLICGRDSAAERDVVENAKRRWPAIEFEIRQVAVQGRTAATEVTAALIDLDSRTDIDVIVITRGGGSAEDLLAFSDEALVRAVAACLTPVVSAIGHEQDAPLLDHVADLRASTPTDAARRIVPDLNEQAESLASSRGRALRAIDSRLERERHRVNQWAHSRALADPSSRIEAEATNIATMRSRASRALAQDLQSASDRLISLQQQLKAMSPAATLERGYAIVIGSDSAIARDADALHPDDDLSIRLARGTVHARVIATKPEESND